MFLNRNYRFVLIGLVISMFGSAIQRFSFSLYLLDMTRDAGVFSLAMAISTVPYIVFAPLAGMTADHRNKKYIMVVLDLLSFASIALYLMHQRWGGHPVAATGVIMVMLATISTFYMPAVTSMVPQIVKEDELVQANAMINQVSSAANLLGPMLAGVMYGVFGIAGVTIFNGVSFLGSAVLECFICYPWTKASSHKTSARSAFGEMKSVFSYLKTEKKLSYRFILSYGMFNISLVPIMTILFPYWLRTMLGVSSEAYGILEGVIAGGMIVGVSLVGRFPAAFPVKSVHRWNYLMSGAIALMIGIAVGTPRSTLHTTTLDQSLQQTPHRAVVFAVCMLGGFCIMAALGIGNVVTLSYTQRVVEKHRLGTVSALSTAMATISVPIGQMLFGQYLEVSDNIALLLLFSGVATGSVILFLRNAVRLYAGEDFTAQM